MVVRFTEMDPLARLLKTMQFLCYNVLLNDWIFNAIKYYQYLIFLLEHSISKLSFFISLLILNETEVCFTESEITESMCLRDLSLQDGGVHFVYKFTPGININSQIDWIFILYTLNTLNINNNIPEVALLYWFQNSHFSHLFEWYLRGLARYGWQNWK